MNLTSISGYALMSKMPEASVIKEPAISFDKLKGDLVKGTVKTTFLTKDWEKASFVVKMAIGEPTTPKVHKVIFRFKVLSEKRMYASSTDITFGIMIVDQSLTISFNDGEIPTQPASEDASTIMIQFDFSFRLTKDTNEQANVFKEDQCAICAEKPAVMMSNPCKHMSMCAPCTHKFIEKSSLVEDDKATMICPMCRGPVMNFLEATKLKKLSY